MSNIIFETLQNKLIQLQKERNNIYNRMQANQYIRICEIRNEFRVVVDKYGISSKEAIEYANKYAQEERELLNEADYTNKHHTEMLNKVIKYDRDILELSNEIACIKIREK